MTDNYDYPAMNERQHVLLQSWPDDAGQDAQSTTDTAGYAVANSPYAPPPEPKPDAKHWYESKTIWFNAIVVAVGLATSATPALEQYMSAEMYGVIASFVAFVNAVLRLVTGQPIKKGGV